LALILSGAGVCRNMSVKAEKCGEVTVKSHIFAALTTSLYLNARSSVTRA